MDSVEFVDEIFQSLIDFGYTVKPTATCLVDKLFDRKHDWIVSNSKIGVRIKVYYERRHNKSATFEMFIRNRIGNYLKLTDCYINYYEDKWVCDIAESSRLSELNVAVPRRCSIESFIGFIKSIKGDEALDNWKKASDLPSPFRFVESIYKCDDSNVSIVHFFRKVKIVNLVTFNDKLVIDENISTPGSEVWFLVNGIAIDSNGTDSDQWIIVNEAIDGFYALSRRLSSNLDFIITPNMTPYGVIDFHRLSVIDQQMINIAVQMYFKS